MVWYGVRIHGQDAAVSEYAFIAYLVEMTKKKILCDASNTRATV